LHYSIISGDVYSNSAELLWMAELLFSNPTSGELNIHISRLKRVTLLECMMQPADWLSRPGPIPTGLLLDISDLKDGLYCNFCPREPNH